MGNDGSAVLPAMSHIAEATTIEEVWGVASRFFAGLGFSRANYGFTRFLYRHNVGDPADAIFLTTGDADYAQSYFQDGFYERTPVSRWGGSTVGACTWRWVRDAFDAGQLTADDMATARQDVVAGVSISFPEATTRSKGALGLIADPGIGPDQVETIWETRCDEIKAVAHLMHLKIITLPQPAANRSLTERQRQALEWVADGKTMQDVAVLMQVSCAMVEKHLRLAREALSVETTTQAVAKASLLNLIFQRGTTSPVVGKS